MYSRSSNIRDPSLAHPDFSGLLNRVSKRKLDPQSTFSNSMMLDN